VDAAHAFFAGDDLQPAVDLAGIELAGAAVPAPIERRPARSRVRFPSRSVSPRRRFAGYRGPSSANSSEISSRPAQFIAWQSPRPFVTVRDSKEHQGADCSRFRTRNRSDPRRRATCFDSETQLIARVRARNNAAFGREISSRPKSRALFKKLGACATAAAAVGVKTRKEATVGKCECLCEFRAARYDDRAEPPQARENPAETSHGDLRRRYLRREC
jgi:hypothetical protein